MSIQIYILSKLMEEDNYPYKLKKELSDPIPFDKIGDLTESKLYYHFESLSKQGLIQQVEVIKEENRPDKQVYAITEKGREILPKKIYELFEKANKLAEVIVGLMFLRYVEKSHIILILEKKLESLHSKQLQLKDIYSHIRVEDTVQEMVDFADGYISDTIINEITWLENLIAKLKKRDIYES
ncbi:transcriptional regulator, PadR family [Psychrobacillus psychrotolerans]|uniref:Transcriptional regulator, PadR family n=1 Tax=Psychrobacillus psychrotolerans TaxID=126156 RepID=A0A1I5VQB8_9BACI|nr:PadR family transcriptional regulator [Psychrobacillus psychrotolerans]SFQ09685.1 transcriptional regulator, PadR family [Psychrobacillus psychrotolerans]